MKNNLSDEKDKEVDNIENIDGRNKQGFLKRRVTNYTSMFVKPVAVAKHSAGNVSSIFSSLFSRLRMTTDIYKANSTDKDTKIMEENFSNVLIKWGIAEDQVESVADYYRSHSKSGMIGTVIMSFFLVGYIFFESSLYYSLSITVFWLASFFLFITSHWRYKVLKNRKFIPFFKWLNS